MTLDGMNRIGRAAQRSSSARTPRGHRQRHALRWPQIGSADHGQARLGGLVTGDWQLRLCVVLASILLVDDDVQFRCAVSRALTGRGYSVDEAGDGSEALKVLKHSAPNILITDVVMPNLDGFELINAVRKSHPDIRILAISGHDRFWDLRLLEMAAELGAAAVLAKPLTIEELLEKIDALAPNGASSE